jgi:hypothetical protein
MKAYFKFLVAILSFTIAAALTIKYFEQPVQEVCVPLHVKLDTNLYKVYREDSIINSDFPMKRVYYTERKKK